jgi:hypothetical protein
MSKTLRQLILLGCVVVGGAALLWYFEYGPSARPIATVKATEASGRGFAIAVPKGFDLADADDDRLKATRDSGGVALAASWRSGAEQFRPSIVVVPLGSPWSGGDLGNDATCADVASQAIGATPGMNLLRHQVVMASFGPTCEWEAVGKQRPSSGAVAIFVAKGSDGWVITCNASPEDQRARSACHEVLRS